MLGVGAGDDRGEPVMVALQVGAQGGGDAVDGPDAGGDRGGYDEDGPAVQDYHADDAADEQPEKQINHCFPFLTMYDPRSINL